MTPPPSLPTLRKRMNRRSEDSKTSPLNCAVIFSPIDDGAVVASISLTSTRTPEDACRDCDYEALAGNPEMAGSTMDPIGAGTDHTSNELRNGYTEMYLSGFEAKTTTTGTELLLGWWSSSSLEPASRILFGTKLFYTVVFDSASIVERRRSF